MVDMGCDEGVGESRRTGLALPTAAECYLHYGLKADYC